MTQNYSCIIPAYNEINRIPGVLEAILRIEDLSRIICVDDGSTDGTGDFVKEKFPRVKLVKHFTNKGKAAAVLTGLGLAKENDNILLLDADLEYLKTEEIKTSIELFEKNQLDCLILHTHYLNFWDLFIRKLLRVPHCMAGTRLIKKTCLVNVLENKFLKNYQLEIAQNQYLMRNQKMVAYTDITALNTAKTVKDGLVKGIFEEIEMWKQIIEYAGWSFFIKQTLLFARKKVT
ncbi:MAG: glycosyltransferase family 2 protein [Candidatus Pacebacteria bacterium]|nr:glycosyltransferase family 2 protein [Candidatus Paceibacterota bacterium]